MRRVDLYIESASKYIGQKDRFTGYVMATETKSGELVTRDSVWLAKGTYNRVIIETIAVALEHLAKGCELWIHCDNGYVLGMIDKNLRSWIDNGFLSAKGAPVKGSETWQRLANASEGQLLVCDYCLHHEYSTWLRAEMARKTVESRINTN